MNFSTIFFAPNYTQCLQLKLKDIKFVNKKIKWGIKPVDFMKQKFSVGNKAKQICFF